MAEEKESTSIQLTQVENGGGDPEAPANSPLGSSSSTRQELQEKEEETVPFNSSNQPFEHVSLQRSEDGQRFVHPLEKFSAMDFVDRSIASINPVEPPLIRFSTFKMVEEVKDLEELTIELQSVNEFAVHLVNGSSQGFTCLMLISTRNQDFIIDTLKLKIHVGPYLEEVFKDPTKKKVMYEAEQDILWLQRDFAIYLCNLFDIGQASKVLKLEINNLEHLLSRFCGVTANKELYSNTDWGLRPLPDEALSYARESTHYLLFIYDIVRIKLRAESSDALLEEVYQRSYDACMQLYQKEPIENGLQGAGVNAVQPSMDVGLSESQDRIARAEDESTGRVLPNESCRNKMDRGFDPEIGAWIIDFLLRKSCNEALIGRLIKDLPPLPPLDSNHPLKKTLLLRTILTEIAAGNVSERILDYLEAIECIDNGQQIGVLESMKKAYCDVALDCTARQLLILDGREKYSETVSRIWRGRIENLKNSMASKLVSEHTSSCQNQVEAAIEDDQVANAIMETNTRANAISTLRLYLSEALDSMGLTHLERELESGFGAV